MSVNGKRDNFTREDLIEFGLKADLTKAKCVKIIEDINHVLEKWETYAQKANVPDTHVKKVLKGLRLDI